VRIWDTFKGSQEYYDECHPVTTVKQKKETLHKSGVLARLLSGGDNLRLTEAIAILSKVMDEADVKHYRKDVVGAGHEFDLILKGLDQA
jgi:hypothetical protein